MAPQHLIVPPLQSPPPPLQHGPLPNAADPAVNAADPAVNVANEAGMAALPKLPTKAKPAWALTDDPHEMPRKVPPPAKVPPAGFPGPSADNVSVQQPLADNMSVPPVPQKAAPPVLASAGLGGALWKPPPDTVLQLGLIEPNSEVFR